MNRARLFKWFLILLAALALAAFAASQVFTSETRRLWWALGSLLFFLAACPLSYFLFERVIWPGLGAAAPRARAGWVAASLLAGVFLALTIPLTPYPKMNHVRVLATGEKNPAAQGSEVWLGSVAAGPKTATTPLKRLCRGDWYAKGALLAFSHAQPEALDCRVKSTSTIAFTFGMHPWSGKVRLAYAGQAVDLDLYSAEGSAKTVTFNVTLSPVEAWLEGLLFAAASLSLGVVVLAAGLWFVRRPLRPFAPPRRPTPWFAYGTLPGLAWAAYLLAFWPGFIASDTITQLGEVVSGVYYNWHPAFHTFTLWLLTRVWFSPAAAAIPQILLLGGLAGWGLALIEARGAPRLLTWGVALFLALNPANGLLLLTPLKDVAYSLALLALSLLAFKVVSEGGKPLQKPLNWALLGVLAALTALYRHNGWPVALGVLLFVFAACRVYWRQMLAALAVGAALWGGVTGPLYWAVGVNTTDLNFGKPQPLSTNIAYLIITHMRSGTPFQPEERALYERFVSPEAEVDPNALAANLKEITRLALRLAVRNPAVTVRYYLSRSAFIFQVTQPSLSRIGYVARSIEDNPYGLASAPLLPALQPKLNRLIDATETPALDWLFWRNAFWMYLMLLAVFVACVRLRSWRWALPLVPVLLNALPLALFSGGQIARYIWPTLLIAPLFAFFYLIIQPPQDHQDGVTLTQTAAHDLKEP